MVYVLEMSVTWTYGTTGQIAWLGHSQIIRFLKKLTGEREYRCANTVATGNPSSAEGEAALEEDS